MTMEQGSCQDSGGAGDKIAAVPATSSPSKTEKRCHICDVVKPTTEFYTAKGHNDGFQSRCISCERTYQKQRRHLYRERHRVYKRQWRAENIEHLRAVDRKYREANKSIWAAKERKRRAKQLENPSFYISKKELQKLYVGPCTYCGVAGKMTLDHVVPIQRGGSHSVGNLVPACGSCNFSKGQKLLIEWRIYKMRKGKSW
jgi:5-methylcytosine-specific restriction endonuclease McrA